MASSWERFADKNRKIEQLLNSVFVGYEELFRPQPSVWQITQTSALKNASGG